MLRHMIMPQHFVIQLDQLKLGNLAEDIGNCAFEGIYVCTVGLEEFTVADQEALEAFELGSGLCELLAELGTCGGVKALGTAGNFVADCGQRIVHFIGMLDQFRACSFDFADFNGRCIRHNYSPFLIR